MSVVVRTVTLSGSADRILRRLAARENLEPEIFGSLVLENAIRERDELERRFAAAAAKVEA